MGVGDGGTGLVLFVCGEVEDTKNGLDKEESEEDGAEDCVGAAIGFE